MAKVFVVEDNDGLRETVSTYLELDGHSVKHFAKLTGVSEAMAMQDPDLLVLDVMLPDGDGFLFARKIRQKSNVPIIFLTARTSESDRITGLEIGGDDYVVKPFSMKELMLRVKAVLSRSGMQSSRDIPQTNHWTLPEEEEASHTQTLILDEARHSALMNGKSLDLTGAEWKILSYLSQHRGMVLSRDRILGACLDYIAEGSERTVDTHIKNLRSKLGSPNWIQTVRGFGYRFEGVKNQ